MSEHDLKPETDRERLAYDLAYEWWTKEGRFIDPDTDDVPWADKRGELAQMAFLAGFKKAEELNRIKRV